MKLSRNSWHYKFFRFAYGMKAKEPNNLCTYFWKVIVIGGLLSFIFLPIWLPPYLLFMLMTYMKIVDMKDFTEYGILSEQMLMCIVIDLMIIVSMCIIAAIISLIPGVEFSDHVEDVGWAVIISCSIIWAVMSVCKLTLKRKKQPKDTKSNIVKTYIKSFYEKNCPIIEWKDKD